MIDFKYDLLLYFYTNGGISIASLGIGIIYASQEWLYAECGTAETGCRSVGIALGIALAYPRREVVAQSYHQLVASHLWRAAHGDDVRLAFEVALVVATHCRRRQALYAYAIAVARLDLVVGGIAQQCVALAQGIKIHSYAKLHYAACAVALAALQAQTALARHSISALAALPIGQ